MNNLDKETAYLNAKRRVDKLRGFYSHLVIYIGVNVLISAYKIIRYLSRGETFEDAFLNLNTTGIWLFWGIGIVIHAFVVFVLPKIIGNNWEEEKIKQFMEDEKDNNFN